MTAVEQHLDQYFGSLNSITRKLWQERKSLERSLKGKWDDLDVNEREEIFGSYLVDSKVRSRYAHVAKEDTPEVFPKLKINSGEKIVVDFENDDGWTWRDEHSGPFSWMTRSQQDLTLDEFDNLEEQPKKQSKSRGKSRSPDRENNTPRRPRESSYNNHEKGTNAEAAHTADEIFQKFGIAFSFGQDGEQAEEIDLMKEVMSPIVESKLLPGELNENFVLGEDDAGEYITEASVYDSSFKDTSLTDSCASSDVGSFDKRASSISNTSAFSNKKHRQNKPRALSSQSEAEIALMSTSQEDSDLDSSMRQSQGQVSPVFIEDPGESSTDPRQSQRFSYTETTVVPDSPSVLGTYQGSVILEQPTRNFDIGDLTNMTGASDSDDLSNWNVGFTDNKNEDDSNPLAKSGFDFLDNW